MVYFGCTQLHDSLGENKRVDLPIRPIKHCSALLLLESSCLVENEFKVNI
jgi:hypothetical protein